MRLQGEARLLAEPDEGPPVEPVDRPERFLVRKLGKEFLINASEIEWLQASGNYVNLRVRGRDYPLRSTMAAIEERLDPPRASCACIAAMPSTSTIWPRSSRWKPAMPGCRCATARGFRAAGAIARRCASASLRPTERLGCVRPSLVPS